MFCTTRLTMILATALIADIHDKYVTVCKILCYLSRGAFPGQAARNTAQPPPAPIYLYSYTV